jgi:hypothetical protein
MKKLDFFLAAMDALEYRRKNWVISAFALIQESVDAWKENPYAYRIVQTPTGYFFVDPKNGLQLTKIEDAKPGVPLFGIYERVSLKAGMIKNLHIDVETRYTQVLVNYITLVFPFGDKLPFMTGKIKVSNVEDLIIDKLQDIPPEGTARDPSLIYVDEFLKFNDAMSFLEQFTQLAVPAASPKSMVAAPGIMELKAKLIEENKDRLYDPAVIAKIDEALIAFDKEYLKGDVSQGFMINQKSYDVRKRMFAMMGAETGLAESVNVELIQNSLEQGWDISKFPAMNNSLRAGSFNRGAQTMLGGEAVKWLFRASSNLSVTQDDCGSVLGNKLMVKESNLKRLVGFSVIVGGKPVKVATIDDAKKYLGQVVKVRSPMYCNLDKTDYCKVCVGDRLAAHPKALSVAMAEYGSAFLGIFMSAMHGKKLSVAKMDIMETMS